jgi:glycosyltransferase involved in cell wall biosynthesis
MSRPFFSVIVPTYNRPEHLGPLLESVLAQSFQDWEVVVGEDCSPARAEVQRICDAYGKRTGGRVRCHLHAENLGYDRGVRGLIEQARGKYLFLMGDDDFVAPDAFSVAANALARHPNTGMILRSLAYFVDSPDNVVKITRYYPDERVFSAGKEAIVACFRRLVSMSGLVMDRDLAHACATDRFDGSLFYQHWIAANILAKKDALYIPDILAYFRLGSPSMWGMAKTERHLYTPGTQPPAMHVKMVDWQFRIADAVQQDLGIDIASDIRADYANYAFPTFAGQAHVPWRQFFRYYRDLSKLGLGRYPMFHAWFWAISLLGIRNVDRVVMAVRKRVGHTPNLTRLPRAPRVRAA